MSEEDLRFHEIVIRPSGRAVLVGSTPIDLSATEYELLRLLTSRPGTTFPRQQIVEMLHGTKYACTPRAVDVQVVGLRRKLGPASLRIQTVRGVGYRFEALPALPTPTSSATGSDQQIASGPSDDRHED